MKLKTISIQGFKSFAWKFPQVIWMDNHDIVLGANGAGKSNIISLFRLLSQLPLGKMRRLVSECGGAQRILNYGYKQTSDIICDAIIEHESIWYNYRFSLSYSAPNTLVFSDESISKVSKGLEMDISKSPNEYSSESMLSQPELDQWQQMFHDFFCGIRVYQFNDSSFSSAMRNVCHKDVNKYLQSDAGNLAAFLLRIKEHFPHNYKRIVRYISHAVPMFGDFVIQPDDTGIVMLSWTDITTSDYEFLPHQLSDGSLRFIALATLLLQPESIMPKMIVIDEPELGLHPSAISLLADMIKEASVHTQVFVATQSPALLNTFELEDVHVIESKRINSKSYSRIVNFTDENKAELNEWLKEYTLSEIWAKNVIGGRP